MFTLKGSNLLADYFKFGKDITICNQLDKFVGKNYRKTPTAILDFQHINVEKVPGTMLQFGTRCLTFG